MPPRSPDSRSIYPGFNGTGSPWPIEPTARVIILTEQGQPVEGAEARMCKSGEYVRYSPSHGVTIEGRIV